MTTFSELLALHDQLDDLFLKHQRALLRLDLDRAAKLLEKYEKEILAHMKDEEELMLPLYNERATAPVGGTADIFIGEHEKLRQYLSLFKDELVRLKKVKDLELAVLFLLDSQHLFKRLLVHHDTREKKFLYPLLDKVTTELERTALFDSLNAPLKSLTAGRTLS